MHRPDRSPLVALLVGMALAVGILFGAHTVDRVNSQQVACHQVNELRGAIVTVLQNGKKGLPQNAYFKSHTTQLGAAQAEYQADIDKLSPIHC